MSLRARRLDRRRFAVGFCLASMSLLVFSCRPGFALAAVWGDWRVRVYGRVQDVSYQMIVLVAREERPPVIERLGGSAS
jgi:hypothetical protein